MKLVARLRCLTAGVFRRSQVDDDMNEELRSHIEHRADHLERAGHTRAAAEREARLEFGSAARFKEECRESMGGNFIDVLTQDTRFSLRGLRKSPGFTVAAVLTLALAIGANAVVFGILNGLILRPLSVQHADTLWGTVYGDDSGFQSYPNYVDLRDRNHSFEDLAAFNFTFVGFDQGHNPSAATGYLASGNYFDVLGVKPYLGRFFHRSDEHGANSAPYVVLSYAYWHSHFQDERDVVGRVVQIDKHPFTIIGIGPPEFHGTISFISPDFFMPIVNQQQVDNENLLGARAQMHGVFEAFGHLKPGVTTEQASADVNAVGAQLAKLYPSEVSHKPSSLKREGPATFGAAEVGFVTGLMLLATLILLAACANLGSLFAARAADRSRELALRLALGSGRSRLLRALFTEAVLIALAGGAAGLLGSVWLLEQLSRWQPFAGAPVHIPVNPDVKVYVVSLILALLSALLFGLVPMRQVLRTDPYQIVKSGSRTTSGRRLTVRDVLLGAQIAICALLVTSSLVGVRGLTRTLHSNFGFERRNTMLANINLAMAGYGADQVLAEQKRLIAAMQTIPGVESVGLVNNYPPLVYTAGTRTNVFAEQTRDLRQANAVANPYRYDISPGYLRAAGTSLLAGRDLSWRDDKTAPAVALVNRTFAGKMFGAPVRAVGRYFRIQDGTRVEVVGVVEDGKYQLVTEDQSPAVFLPFLRSPVSSAYLVIRSRRDPQQLTAAMRTEVREIDAGLPVDIQTWNTLLAVVLFPARVATLSLGVLGIMGAMLSITGIFGMAAYSVSKRLKELGIRMALGAERKAVLQAALGRALKLLVFGSAAGLLLGILASRVLASIVYQATPRDPLVLTGVVLAMALLGLLATWIPAQRALSASPLTLLREE